MSLSVKALREGGYGMVRVTGGPFSSAQTMTWHLLNGNETVAVVANEKTAMTIEKLIELHRLLVSVDALKHLRARFDQGYLEIPVPMLRSIEKLLAESEERG